MHVDLLCNLAETDFVKEGALEDRVDCVQTAEHVLALLLEVNKLFAVINHLIFN